MSARVLVVYHSVGGRTRALAEAVVRGASEVSGVSARAVDASEARAAQDALAEADAIVFGAPTYMGSASAAFKAFMDSTAPVWALQGWRDKLAAGFTHSAAPSGDKLGTLTQLAVFAAQHGMIWVGLGLPPTYAATSEPGAELGDMNRLGSHLGAMAQSAPGAALSAGDVRTCVHLGRRVAEHAVRWTTGRALPRASTTPGPLRHATTSAWQLPPARPALPGVRRTNLRELAARPARFEHHLTVVARAGTAQLEIATASEPLYFAHINVSDEYAIALPTGDDLADRFPMRTFLTDPATLEDVARYNHRVGDLVLHPLGLLHWPGRLRPPFEPFAFPKGMRRCGLSLVFCASSPPVPTTAEERPLFVTEGRAADAKSYAPSSPLVLCDVARERAWTVARVGDASLSLVVRPTAVTAPRGAYVVVLEADADSAHHACDLVYVDPGSTLVATGIARALVFASDAFEAEPPPASWDRVPDPPFAPFEEGPRGALPFAQGGITVTAKGESEVLVRMGGASAVVPRHWLARMLFRIALHPWLGYVETYGGFFYDDRGSIRVGLRGGEPLVLAPDASRALVEALYRAVAPEGYVERVT